LAARLSRRLCTRMSSTRPSWSTARHTQCFLPAIVITTSSRCHVWMPPNVQEDFERLDHVIGCGHVSGLQMRPDRAAGRYGDTRTWRKSFVRALSSLAPVAFPGPDLTDHLTLPSVDLLTRPMFPSCVVRCSLRSPQLWELGNLPPSPAWPRASAPFCWRAQSLPASLVCAPACAGASFPPAHPSVRPRERRPSRR
jgi:hypothetical protein